MEFAPPADARVITAQQLDAMIAEELDEPLPNKPARAREKLPVELKGPVLLKGNIAGKEISVTDGGLWIDGNVENCDLSVETTASKKAVEEWLESAAKDVDPQKVEEKIQQTRREAAEAGIGLHIKGDVKKCDEVMAPNISIIGDVVAGSNQPTDRENWTNRNRFIAAGNIHIDGNIKGQKETQAMCPTVEYWHTERADDFPLKAGETIAGKMLEQLDQLSAIGNIRISGNAEGFGLASEGGSITIGGKKSGFVITKTKGQATIENQPENAAQPAQKGRIGKLFGRG
jgi:hypothetical protein